MSKSPAGVVLCEPTHLYNILTQSTASPAVLSDTYLNLFDARDITHEEFSSAHILLARQVHTDGKGEYHIPFGVHLPTCRNCVVYDSNTVSTVEDTPAVKLATQLSSSGSMNAVMILKGGYERFSAEYPFLRTHKIIFTQTELECLPRYPNEVLPLSLYLGEQCHAYNASLNYDLKIHAHVSVGTELHTAFPGSTPELHIDVEDAPDSNLLDHFEDIFQFIESHRKKSNRVLVYSELGISRSAAAVVAYLIKRNSWSLKEAYDHVVKCRGHIQLQGSFMEQLDQWAAIYSKT